jgi:AcrR family transcriptional regulator
MQGRTSKPGLSVERVVATGIELADADGLEGVSMAKVARQLGFTPMSLYRHVASKQELLLLMSDTTYGAPPPIAAADGWRVGLERWAHAIFDVQVAHPWLLHVPISGPPTTPHMLAWFDAALEALADTPLEEGEKTSIVLLVNGVAFWQARIATDVAATADESGVAPEAVLARQGAMLAELGSGGRFPALQRVIDAGLFDEEDDEDDFGFALELALGGVERLVERRGGG